MGVIIRISKESKKEQTTKALEILTRKSKKKTSKTIADFYGKLKGAYGDGLAYQKKLRNEW